MDELIENVKIWAEEKNLLTKENRQAQMLKVLEEVGETAGALLKNKNQEIIECQSKPNLKIVDLTGAGDLFAAGFLHGFINNCSTKESLKKGTEMSSKIIQKVGARLD